MTTYLLDVNLLLALTDPMHVHHGAAHHWFAEKGRRAWATRPLTENSFVRIAGHPSYPNRPGDVPAVPAMVRQLWDAPGHHFWTEDIGILQVLEPNAIISHAQIVDTYLLGLAVHKRGKLATLDRGIPVHPVRGGSKALQIIMPPWMHRDDPGHWPRIIPHSLDSLGSPSAVYSPVTSDQSCLSITHWWLLEPLGFLLVSDGRAPSCSLGPLIP